MKKQLSFLYLALCISFNAFSQTSVIQAPIPGANAFERFLNTPITKKLVLNGAKVASGFIVANKFKFIVGGTVLSGIAGYNYLIHNPEKMGEFFGTHPELLNEFSKYLDYRIANAQTQEELDTFNNVKYKLALDQNINNSQSIAITNDPVYQNLEDDVREEVDKTIIAINESGNMPQCNINVVAQILEPEEDFHKGVNNILPSIENIPTKILNVNTYKNLHDNYKKKLVPEPLTPDHIPSYGALAKYFASWNLPIPTVRKDSNLELNSTSITVPTELHQKGSRTYGGRNRKKDSNNDSLMIQDAKNLLEATILDIATTAYLFYSNNKYNIIPEEYIKSSMVIVARNKLLCMYDVPYN